MRPLKRYFHPLPLLCFLLLCGLLYACMDEQLLSTSYDNSTCGPEGERDMQLKVAVSGGTYGSGSGESVDKESRIDTLDVLVFAPDNGGTMRWRAAATGTPVVDEEGKLVLNQYEVVMPLGEGMDVHVFVNSHHALAQAKAFNRPGTEMETVLASITQNLRGKLEDPDTSLPMHGMRTKVNINKDSDDKLPVSVLRSVAKVSVMLKGTIDTDQTLHPTELKEFKLRELYAFFPANDGRVATADTTRFITIQPDSGNVVNATLPPGFKGGSRPDSISVIKTQDVGLVQTIYLYENIPWSKDGFDYVTSRMVVGGIYYDNKGNPDRDKEGNPRVSYYRVNFQEPSTDANGKPVDKQYPVLRNHNYVLNIVSVAAPGYDTPRQAAEGKPINIVVSIIEWADELHDIDYDGQHYFKTSTKEIRLSRNKDTKRVLTVESDVPADEWSWYFAEKTNGATTPPTWYKKKDTDIDSIAPTKSLTLENSRFKVARAQIMGDPVGEEANPTNRATLTVTALKAYSDKPGQLPDKDESYKNILVIKIKNLTVYFDLEQLNKSQDDWGNGGDQGNDVGQKTEEGTVDDVETEDWDDDGTDVGGESNFD